MNMRESMGKAMWEAGFQEPWKNVDFHTKQLVMQQIDAILDAMREPGAKVIDVGNDVSADAGDIWEPSLGISYGGPNCGLEVWQAMIDAIKAGK